MARQDIRLRSDPDPHVEATVVASGGAADAPVPVGIPASITAELLTGVEQAIVVQDPASRVRLLSGRARELFPSLAVGAPPTGVPLTESAAGDGHFEAEHGGRVLRGSCRPLPGGWRGWYVTEAPAPARAAAVGFLLEAARQIATPVDLDGTGRAVAKAAVPVLGDCALVLLPAPRHRLEWWCCGGERLLLTSGRARAPSAGLAPVLSAVLGGSGTASPDGAELAGLLDALPIDAVPADLAERGLLAVSLSGEDGCQGALVLAGDEVDPGLAAEFAALAAAAIRTGRRQRDQSWAARVLAAPLRPPELPALPFAQLAATYRPARGAVPVGGDFYDVHPGNGGDVLLLLGDVSGHGIEAAAVTGRIRPALAALTLVERDPTRLLYLLNEAMLATGSNRFATLVLGSVVPAADKLVLTLSSGGHPPPLVLRADGTVKEVFVPGTLLGVLPHARFGRTVLRLAPGELCLFYSDGITEARREREHDEVFGLKRLAAALARCRRLPAEAALASLERCVEDWLGDRDHDDMAMLAVQAGTGWDPRSAGSQGRNSTTGACSEGRSSREEEA